MSDGEGGGVPAEVVAELVRQHPRQLTWRELLDRERRDDHEVPAARERVWQPGQDRDAQIVDRAAQVTRRRA